MNVIVEQKTDPKLGLFERFIGLFQRNTNKANCFICGASDLKSKMYRDGKHKAYGHAHCYEYFWNTHSTDISMK